MTKIDLNSLFISNQYKICVRYYNYYTRAHNRWEHSRYLNIEIADVILRVVNLGTIVHINICVLFTIPSFLNTRLQYINS